YGQKEEFAWRIQDKKLDKNSGVYKYIFECQHAGNYQSKKKATDPSQQCNRNASGPSITKLNLTHHGYTLCPDNAHFINVYQQLPQNIINKIRFYIKAVPDISQHTLRQLLQGDITDPEKDPENDVSNLLKALRTFKEEDPTWFIADYCDFNTGMSSTQYVKLINAVIHKYVNSHSSLMGFFNGIQAMLASELQKAKYRDYLESLPYNVGSSASIRADIVDNATCIEDDSDKRQVALKSLIRHVDPNNIIELWEVRHMNVNTVLMNFNTLFDSCGISDSSEKLFTNNEIQASFSTMNTI
ncbi:10289_t:CDS:2, partial [Dentiscutata heterogama]